MYMYQKLKEAVYGSTNIDTVSSSWSPNSIKSIMIGVDFILISYHVQNVKLIKLNHEDSYNDILKNGSGGSLHNILTRRQLSCLEEIYVSVAYKSYTGIFDLDYYVSSLMSTSSRLRYYGYFKDFDGLAERVNQLYYNSRLNGIKDYSLALDDNKGFSLEVVDTNNVDWYKKYNLRPELYSTDKEKSTLHTWLVSVENEVDEKYKKVLEEKLSQAKGYAFVTAVPRDIVLVSNYFYLVGVIELIKKGGVSTIVSNHLVEEYNNGLKHTKYLTKEDLISTFTKLGLKKDNKNAVMYLLYANKFIVGNETINDVNKLVDIAENVYLSGLDKFYERVFSSLLESKRCKGSIAMSLVDDVDIFNIDINKYVYNLLESKDYNKLTDILLGTCGYKRENVFRHVAETLHVGSEKEVIEWLVSQMK